MRKINIHNYEEFFIDYLDGKLSQDEKVMVQLFLDSYPELKSELDAISELELEPQLETFELKHNLKKTYSDIKEISYQNLDELILAQKDGELDEKTSRLLNNFIQQDQQAGIEADFLNKTFLQPDLSIKFPRKNRLKKPVLRSIILNSSYWISGVAAALILYFGMNKFVPDQSFNNLSTVIKPLEVTDNTNQNTSHTEESIIIPELKRQITTDQFAEITSAPEIIQEIKSLPEMYNQQPFPEKVPVFEKNVSISLARYETPSNLHVHININTVKIDAIDNQNFAQIAFTEFAEFGRSSVAFVAQRVNRFANDKNNLPDFQQILETKIPSNFALDTENFGIYRSSARSPK